MNTIDNYLRQVSRWLPVPQRKRILAAVREDIEEVLADTNDVAEAERRIKAFGTPPVVAARYLDFPHIIPGMLVPAYCVVLLFSIASMVLVNATLFIPRQLHGEPLLSNLVIVLSSSVSHLPLVFSVVTVVFTVLGFVVQQRTRTCRKDKTL
jgi:hypothetical protein